MEILDAMMELIKAAPELAIYILLILYGFKVVVVGSIYGVIRYVVDRIATAIERWRQNVPVVPPVVHTIELSKSCGARKLLITGTEDAFIDFMVELRRITRTTNKIKSEYIHDSDLEFALQAIREKQQRDEAAGK